MRKILFLLLVINLSSFAKEIDVDKSTDYTDLANYVWYYASDSAISPNDFQELNWQNVNGELNFGIVNDVYFLRVIINNKESENIDRFIYLPFQHIEQIEFFNHSKLIAFTGTRSDKEEFRYGSGYGIPVDLIPGKNEFYIKITHLHQPLRLGAYLLKSDTLNKTVQENENSLFFWKGIFFLALFLSLIMYWMTKLKSFLFYFLLYFGVGIHISVDVGDYGVFFGADTGNFILDIKHIGVVLCMVFFPRFINELNGISKIIPKTWKFFDYIALGMIPLFFVGIIPAVKESYFISYIIGYYVAGSGIIFLAQLVFLIYGIFKKVSYSIELMLVYAVYIPSVFMDIILPNAGVTEESLLVYQNIVYISIIEIVLFLVIVSRQTFYVFKERNELRVEQKSAQLQMVRSIVENQEAERDRIGRELHDMVGGNISIIKQSLKTEDEKLKKLFNDTVESVRSLSHGLVTPDLRKGSFEEEIRDLVQLSSGNQITFRCNFFDWPTELSDDVSKNLYRIVQELIQNAFKHSGATKVFLQFYGGEKLSFFYEDNGKGAHLASVKKGRGLDGVENRAKVLRGKVKINTQPGAGFELSITI